MKVIGPILVMVLALGAYFVQGNSPFSGNLPAVVRYEIDAGKSKFMVKARRGGLAWF